MTHTTLPLSKELFEAGLKIETEKWWNLANHPERDKIIELSNINKKIKNGAKMTDKAKEELEIIINQVKEKNTNPITLTLELAEAILSKMGVAEFKLQELILKVKIRNGGYDTKQLVSALASKIKEIVTFEGELK